MNEDRSHEGTARSVFAGLVPSIPVDETHDESRDRGRFARGVRHTVPILLMGSMAATMLNVTGPIESAHAKRPPGPKAAASGLGTTVKQAIAAANATVASTANAIARTMTVSAPPTTYRVTAGDTVSDIAGRFGLSTASVLALNGLGWSSLIFPGQELKLTSSGPIAAVTTEVDTPASGRYTIVAGDTISGIAARFGVSTLSVLTANGLGWSSIIYPGQTIAIPGVVHPDDVAPPAEPETVAPDDEPSDEAPVVDETPIVTVPVVETAPIAEAPVEAPAPPPPAPAPAPANGSYTIVSGDTISRIAGAFGITTQALLDANGLDWSSVIHPGGTLVIPGVTTPVLNAVPTSSNGSITYLNDEMRANAAVIVQVGREQGVPDYGIIIALATAMQESSLRNLTWGDLDSVGLFQQRPSSGWGTVEELTNARHAAYTFYQGRAGYTRGLLDISGWESMPLTVAAQRVQISAYPDAYAKWEASARAWFAELG